MTSQDQEPDFPWFQMDYIEVTVKNVDYVPHLAVAESIAANIDDSLLRYEPRGQETNIINLKDNTSHVEIADHTTVMFNQSEAIIEAFQDHTSFGFQFYDNGHLETEIQKVAQILHQTAEALPIPQEADGIDITISMNTDHQAPGWPPEGEHQIIRTYQTDNGLEFQQTTIYRRDEDDEDETTEPSWDLIINVTLNESKMPGAYDMELLIKAAYATAAFVILSDIMEVPPQPPDR